MCDEPRSHRDDPARDQVTFGALAGYQRVERITANLRSTMLRMLGSAVLVLAVSLVAACDGTASISAGGPTAQLKVVHAAPSLGAVSVAVGNSTVINGLTFGSSSGVTTVPGGSQRLSFRAAGVEIAHLDLTLAASGINAVALNGDTAQVTPVTPDTGHAATNRANIRMINIAGENATAPYMLSALVNFPGVSADSVASFGLDTRVPSHGPLMYFDPGHFRFRFVAQGNTTVLTEVEFDVSAGQKKAVVLERSTAGAYSVRIVTEP
jgi:hypothetical protein